MAAIEALIHDPARSGGRWPVSDGNDWRQYLFPIGVGGTPLFAATEWQAKSTG